MKVDASWLEKAAQRARQDVAARQRAKPAPLLQALAKAAPRPPPFEAAVRRATPVRVVAELKRRTPERFLDRDLDVTEAARAFEDGGACALVVATEPTALGGAPEDIARARAGTKLPILRRDAFVDRYQLAEARVGGASAVWLVASLLPGKALPELLRAAAELGLEAAVELHDAPGLTRALDAGASMVVLTGAVEETLPELAATAVRAGALVLARGVRAPDDARRLAAAGVDAVLVGSWAIASADRARAVAACRERAG